MDDRGSYDYQYNLIAEYVKSKYNREVPIKKIQEQPNHIQWGLWMDALAWFKLDDNYNSLDEVPDHCKDGRMVKIRTKGRLDFYDWYEGKWRRLQEILDEWYKG